MSSSRCRTIERIPMSADRTPAEFPLSFSRWMRILTAPMLVGPQYCTATISPDRLDVKMGIGSWAFAANLHRSSIVRATQVNRPVWAWGAHGWRGRWLVNGSSHGLVQLTIDPPE